MSEAADAETVTDAALCQVADPPLTEVGAVGSSAVDGDQLRHPSRRVAGAIHGSEADQCLSFDADRIRGVQLTGVDQLAPASVDSRYS